MRRDGWIGWVAVGAVVAAWNVRALRSEGEMLSEYAHRHRVAFVLGAGYLAIHFAGPDWFSPRDPLHLVADRFRKDHP